jgi:hypothetical protein
MSYSHLAYDELMLEGDAYETEYERRDGHAPSFRDGLHVAWRRMGREQWTFQRALQDIHPTSPSPAPPSPPPSNGSPPLRLRLDDSRRWFRDDHGLVDYREVSCFTLHTRFRRGEPIIDLLHQYRMLDINAVRIICSLGGIFWERLGFDVEVSEERAGLLEFVRFMASQQFYVRLCLIGALEPLGANDTSDRRNHYRATVRERALAHVAAIAVDLANEQNVLFEVANEYNQIGFGSDASAIIELGHVVKSVAPNVLLNLSNDNGPNADTPTFLVSPADFIDAHFERRKGMGGFEWVKRTGETPVVDQGVMAAMSGEPINAGTAAAGREDDAEDNPAVWFAYGAVSRVKRYLTNFHYHGGLTAEPMDATTLACAHAWRRGLSAIPMDFGGAWCNGHHECSPFDRGIFPPTDDVDGWHGPVRIYGRRGSRGYIGVSVREPQLYSPRLKPGRSVSEVDGVAGNGWQTIVRREH